MLVKSVFPAFNDFLGRLMTNRHYNLIQFRCFYYVAECITLSEKPSTVGRYFLHDEYAISNIK